MLANTRKMNAKINLGKGKKERHKISTLYIIFIKKKGYESKKKVRAENRLQDKLQITSL